MAQSSMPLEANIAAKRLISRTSLANWGSSEERPTLDQKSNSVRTYWAHASVREEKRALSWGDPVDAEPVTAHESPSLVRAQPPDVRLSSEKLTQSVARSGSWVRRPRTACGVSLGRTAEDPEESRRSLSDRPAPIRECSRAISSIFRRPGCSLSTEGSCAGVAGLPNGLEVRRP